MNLTGNKVQTTPEDLFFDRDISWLSFNERVLLEAKAKEVPLFERIKFLSIYSSNLDEFYRVRIPSLMALKKIAQKKVENNTLFQNTLDTIQHIVNQQQKVFGTIMNGLLPELRNEHIHLVYDEPIPAKIHQQVIDYFFTEILSFLQIVQITAATEFFPENNKLYKIVIPQDQEESNAGRIVTIPSDDLPRFFSTEEEGVQYIVFIDDIIKLGLRLVFKSESLSDYNFKVTRDAALELDDEYDESLAEKMEKKIAKRDFSFATRFLFDSRMPAPYLQLLIDCFKLKDATIVLGGPYHNLKDLATLPIHNPKLAYPKITPVPYCLDNDTMLFEKIAEGDILLNVPYESYTPVLRFFNEAAINPQVEEIYVTLYRVASDSRIANALISAARNGKKVTVIVELKARFDEANNIKWSKFLKKAGVKIIYSIPSLKVHAKIALVKFSEESALPAFGLLATGNLNENTARFYTDHIIMTQDPKLTHELEKLFRHLGEIKKISKTNKTIFSHLLVAKFNLRDRFMAFIDREIDNQKKGLASGITLKMNNLEEKKLIGKLYEASNAGVHINLIIRGICCLIPGVPQMSENIVVHRIIDRYLEHGRIFIFKNNDNPLVYMGSADWMNRNIYNRIEVCFPIYDVDIKEEIMAIVQLQLEDTSKAVLLDSEMHNVPFKEAGKGDSAQQKIYEYTANRKTT